jgi:hypothetical protein
MPYPKDLVCQMVEFIAGGGGTATRKAFVENLPQEKRAAFNGSDSVRRNLLYTIPEETLRAAFTPEDWKVVVRITERTLIERMAAEHKTLSETQERAREIAAEVRRSENILERYREALRAIFEV